MTSPTSPTATPASADLTSLLDQAKATYEQMVTSANSEKVRLQAARDIMEFTGNADRRTVKFEIKGDELEFAARVITELKTILQVAHAGEGGAAASVPAAGSEQPLLPL